MTLFPRAQKIHPTSPLKPISTSKDVDRMRAVAGALDYPELRKPEADDAGERAERVCRQ